MIISDLLKSLFRGRHCEEREVLLSYGPLRSEEIDKICEELFEDFRLVPSHVVVGLARFDAYTFFGCCVRVSPIVRIRYSREEKKQATLEAFAV